jgi:aryl-alcohol dehydrogenase-like predicted oxidoreductase
MSDPSTAPTMLSLPGGEPVSALGLGTWRMGEDGAAHGAELAALRLALDIGYRVFDTAEMYAEGGAETLLGEALTGAMRGAVLPHAPGAQAERGYRLAAG